MSGQTLPIEINLDVTLWIDCTDDNGKKYSQLTIEETPRLLYNFIPITEEGYIPRERVFLKSIELKFKRKKYILQFLRTKEAGEP